MNRVMTVILNGQWGRERGHGAAAAERYFGTTPELWLNLHKRRRSWRAVRSLSA
ncbi:MAG: hypothetical protein OXC54_10160 [Rhodospirillaceae bacterium]|nr:hypothetical protein [Rhodospirillaceae bacterium]